MDLNDAVFGDVDSVVFTWYDYAMFWAMLALSALIGVYFGYIKRQTTPAELLLGNKEMSVIPIALSLISSSISGTTMLTVPGDVYRFGFMYLAHSLTIFVVGLVTYLVYVPVFRQAQVTSTFEYLQVRFSSTLRIVASSIFAFASITYLPIVIYAPALAFSQATGASVHLIAPLVCAVCIFYTTIGGLKAVVWTDALQFGVMLGATLCVFYMGLIAAGGWSNVWSIASEGDRVTFNFDVDPTRRDSFFAMFIGSTFNFMGYLTIGQSFVQKYLALPSMGDVKKAMYYSVAGNSILLLLTVSTGVIMYAHYAECDPMVSGKITAHDQILPYYVIDVTRAIPGLSGLFLSGIFSAALSTLSAYLNCLSATIYEDFVAPFMPAQTTPQAAGKVLKLIVVIVGIICTALVFVVERMGQLLTLQWTLNGITAGSLLGLFTLGMLSPGANSRGAMTGTLGSLAIMTWIVVQNRIYESQGLIEHTAKNVSVAGCVGNVTVPQIDSTFIVEEAIAGGEPFILFRITFYYYTVLGTLLVLVIGVPASWILGGDEDKKPTNKSLISPVMHWTVPKDKTSARSDVLYCDIVQANSIVTDPEQNNDGSRQ